jgi:hypothetical protein
MTVVFHKPTLVFGTITERKFNLLLIKLIREENGTNIGMKILYDCNKIKISLYSRKQDNLSDIL